MFDFYMSYEEKLKVLKMKFVFHPEFPGELEVLMKLWSHVDKEAVMVKDELRNVISPLTGGDNTALQSSLDAVGLWAVGDG